MNKQEAYDFLTAHGIAYHPNENTATVWMQTADLIRIIEEHGNEVQVLPYI